MIVTRSGLRSALRGRSAALQCNSPPVQRGSGGPLTAGGSEF